MQGFSSYAGRRMSTSEELISVGDVCVVVPAAILVVNNEQNNTQEETHRAYSDVSNAKEGVFPSHPGDGAQNHTLLAVEAAHRVI